MAAPPTLAEDVKLPTPLFLRKLRRRQDWGDDETPLEQRAADLVKVMWRCEPHPESPFSVYLVHTDEDFQRVVIGMNGGRLSLTSDSDFIGLLPSDLEAVGVSAERSDGATLCASRTPCTTISRRETTNCSLCAGGSCRKGGN